MSDVIKGKHGVVEKVALIESYERNAGNISAVSRELGLNRETVLRNVKGLGRHKKPLAGGKVHGNKPEAADIPTRGIYRYILTAAQNNTKIHEKFWENLLALAKHYKAEILVGTYSYNQNAYGELAVKRGTKKAPQLTLWYDPVFSEAPKDGSGRDNYFCDVRKQLAKGLVWCGEYNALPTAVHPLAGLESYSARESAIFPHAKQSMRSIPTMLEAGTKLNFTTGTVTKMNYIQKRAGTIAEHHHIYGALLVEVNPDGNWWVRQLNAESKSGRIQDLDVVVDDGVITTGNRVEAITWGDLHSTWIDPEVNRISTEMLDELKPAHQFFHDILKGWIINPHASKRPEPHYLFHTWLKGFNRFEKELDKTIEVLNSYDRPWCKSVAVDSNHDDPWIQRWLREGDYRKDPPNAEFFLKAQAYLYSQIRGEDKMARDVNMLEWCLKERGYTAPTKFLIADESFLICNRKIECGMHGYLGPGGRFGTPENLSKMGRRANTAHTHSAGIYDGLYVAGTSSKLRWTYNKGPNAWTHSHIVTYPNGKRTIITIYAGAWRAK